MSKNKNIRLTCFDLLLRITKDGAYPDILLNSTINKNRDFSTADIRLLTEIVYGVLRWKLRLQYYLNQYTQKQLANNKIELLLLIAIYQIFYLDSVPDYACINETVKIAGRRFDKRIKSLVNGVLRNIARGKDSITLPDKEKDIVHYYSVYYSYPEWLVKKWIDMYGNETVDKLLSGLNKHTKATIRVNTARISRDEFIVKAGDNYGLQKTEVSDCGLITGDIHGLINSDYYKNGLFSVQDESSQIVSAVLDPMPGDTVLDACSAPGTKSNHIAELINNNGRIISCDINEQRLGLVKKDAERLGNSIIETVCADASQLTFDKGIKFDRILVDAPCSGLGTIKNNPDIKWNKTEEDISLLTKTQLQILNQVSRYIKAGGILVYSVCTLTKEENELVCSRFLGNNINFNLYSTVPQRNEKINRLLDKNGYFSSLDYIDQMDGFFIAKFRKDNDE